MPLASGSSLGPSEIEAPSGNSDPWESKAALLRIDLAKFREEVERLLEVEELRTFIHRTRYNRASRRLRPHNNRRQAEAGLT